MPWVLPASYQLGTSTCFIVSQSAKAWTWPFTLHITQVYKCTELCLHTSIHLHAVVFLEVVKIHFYAQARVFCARNFSAYIWKKFGTGSRCWYDTTCFGSYWWIIVLEFQIHAKFYSKIWREETPNFQIWKQMGGPCKMYLEVQGLLEEPSALTLNICEPRVLWGLMIFNIKRNYCIENIHRNFPLMKVQYVICYTVIWSLRAS